jgi:hypothetical protein
MKPFTQNSGLYGWVKTHSGPDTWYCLWIEDLCIEWYSGEGLIQIIGSEISAYGRTWEEALAAAVVG